MLYYYFKSKEKLFHHVIEHCYADLVSREEALDLDFVRPREALAALVAFNWNYYWEHPELLSILASENLFELRRPDGKNEEQQNRDRDHDDERPDRVTADEAVQDATSRTTRGTLSHSYL